MSIFFQIFKNFGFRFQHTVSVTQVLQMAGANIRDHTGIGSCNLRKSGHLTKIADSHFQNCDLILVTKAEYGEWKT